MENDLSSNNMGCGASIPTLAAHLLSAKLTDVHFQYDTEMTIRIVFHNLNLQNDDYL